VPLSSTTNIASGAASRRIRKFAYTHSGRLILSCRIERSWLIFEIAWPHFGVRYTWAFEPKKMAVQWLESLACWGIGDSFIRKYPASIWKRELYKIPYKEQNAPLFRMGRQRRVNYSTRPRGRDEQLNVPWDSFPIADDEAHRNSRALLQCF